MFTRTGYSILSRFGSEHASLRSVDIAEQAIQNQIISEVHAFDRIQIYGMSRYWVRQV
jgi:hypothetical protein